jgi:hypothetical protein
MFIVKATPVLSLTIFAVTNDDGVLVGNGPAVSEGVTEQLPDVVVPTAVLEFVPVVVVAAVSSSVLQELITGIVKEPNPTKPNPLKKSFLFIKYKILNA